MPDGLGILGAHHKRGDSTTAGMQVGSEGGLELPYLQRLDDFGSIVPKLSNKVEKKPSELIFPAITNLSYIVRTR